MTVSGVRQDEASRPAVEGPNVTAGRFWIDSWSPAGSGCLLLFAIPCVLVLALSFGYVDDLGRAVYSTKTEQLRGRVRPDLHPGAAALGALRAGSQRCSAWRSATRSRTTSRATGAATATR